MPLLGEMADFAVLLGVDYLDRAYSNSVAKVKGFFPNWRSEINGQVKGKKSRAGIPGYFQKLLGSLPTYFSKLLVLLSTLVYLEKQ